MFPLGAIVVALASLALQSNKGWPEETLAHHDLRITEFEESGRGLQTLRDRDAGELLLAVPESYAVSGEGCLNEYSVVKKAARKARDSNIGLTDAQIMALGVLRMREENDPRVCCLPGKQFSTSLMPESIKHCLPPAHRRCVEDIRRKHVEVYHVLRDTLGDVTLEDFLWAVATTQSRSFAVENEGLSRRIMLPGIDLVNHRAGNEASLLYDATLRRYEFRSRVPFAAGDEVTFSYGDADNLTWLVNFGFCVPANPERVISHDLDDVLLAAQSILPNIYPDPVCSAFVRGLKEEGTYPDPPLFAYDGKARAPRSCLSNAAGIVLRLGEELAQMPLTGLDKEIVRRLLVKRRQDLQASLGKIKQVEVDNEWHPFVSCLCTLFHDELQTLG